MGHRAVVAYERPGGGYTVRYSQWGARGYRLVESVTASTPLAGGGGKPSVRPEPLGTAPDLPTMMRSFVDPLLHEAVYVVSGEFDVRAYEPLSFWGTTLTAAFGGAAVELRRDRDPVADARELRAWCRGAAALATWPQAAVDDDLQSVSDGEAAGIHDRLFDALESAWADRDCRPIPPAAERD